MATKKPLRTLSGHTEGVRSLSISTDGTVMASASWDKVVRVWRVDTGACVRRLEGHTAGVRSCAYAPKGNRKFAGHLLSGSADKTLRLWSASGASLRTFEGHTDAVFAVGWNTDAVKVASGSEDRSVRVWLAATGKCLAVLNGHADGVRSLSWIPYSQGWLASGSGDGSVKVWSSSEATEVATLAVKSPVWAVACSTDGRYIASGSADDTVRLWDASAAALVGRPAGHKKSAWPAEPEPPAPSRLVATLVGHSGTVWSVAFAPDGNSVVSSSRDRSLRVWEVPAGGIKAVLTGHNGIVWSVAYVPDSKQLISASADKSLKVWRAPAVRASKRKNDHPRRDRGDRGRGAGHASTPGYARQDGLPAMAASSGLNARGLRVALDALLRVRAGDAGRVDAALGIAPGAARDREALLAALLEATPGVAPAAAAAVSAAAGPAAAARPVAGPALMALAAQCWHEVKENHPEVLQESADGLLGLVALADAAPQPERPSSARAVTPPESIRRARAAGDRSGVLAHRAKPSSAEAAAIRAAQGNGGQLL